jgi:hypothetical protein
MVGGWGKDAHSGSWSPYTILLAGGAWQEELKLRHDWVLHFNLQSEEGLQSFCE